MRACISRQNMAPKFTGQLIVVDMRTLEDDPHKYFIDPKHLSPDWGKPLMGDETTVYWTNEKRGLKVLLSVTREADGKLWKHVSVSHKHRLPQWKEIVEIKEMFIGKDQTAYQVLPPSDKYVNVNPVVLHLWSCLDGPVTPDFTRGSDLI